MGLFERVPASVFCGIAEFGFDAEQLIVFRHALAPTRRAGLDLSCIQTHDDIRDGAILCLARAMGDDAGPSGAMRATAKAAMVESSVSPERCETIAVQPAR